MQSVKKFKREPYPKMSATEFAIPYANSVGSVQDAIYKATRHEQIARESATRQTDKFEKKYSLNVAGFWNNVGGILKKHQEVVKAAKK